MEVGYDLGWTSNGLRITKIKVSSPPATQPGGLLEGERGQSQDLSAQNLSDKDSQ
jgi:hypothetical protein